MRFPVLINLAISKANSAYREYTQVNGIPGTVTGGCKSSLTVGQVISYTAMNSKSSWIMTNSTVRTATDIGAIALKGWNVARATSAASSSSPTSSSQTNTSIPSPNSSGLSTGAKAGIGVGVALGTIGLCSLLLAVFLLRRRKLSKGPISEQPMPVEKDSNPVQELRAKQVPAELEGSQLRN
jgi:hypothetical protein